MSSTQAEPNGPSIDKLVAFRMWEKQQPGSKPLTNPGMFEAFMKRKLLEDPDERVRVGRRLELHEQHVARLKNVREAQKKPWTSFPSDMPADMVEKRDAELKRDLEETRRRRMSAAEERARDRERSEAAKAAHASREAPDALMPSLLDGVSLVATAPAPKKASQVYAELSKEKRAELDAKVRERAEASVKASPFASHSAFNDVVRAAELRERERLLIEEHGAISDSPFARRTIRPSPPSARLDA